MRNRSLIRQDERIRTLLNERFKEIGLSQKEVLMDAEHHGFLLPSAALSRYLSGKEQSGRSILTEEQILWLCRRYCINITVIIEPEKYDYTKAERNLRV